jgi:hypothetical protein
VIRIIYSSENNKLKEMVDYEFQHEGYEDHSNPIITDEHLDGG